MPVALVTGASRGIGKSIAVHLARAGYDLALLARTVHEGEPREHSLTMRQSDTSPLPGSLDTTAQAVEAIGVRALTVAADLTDRATVLAAVRTVLDEWGTVDILVNNGRYIGPGIMDRFMESPIALLDVAVEANLFAPLVLIKELLPGMLERGAGCIVNITTGAAYSDPPAPAREGGWAIGYGTTKGGLHRVAGILAVELGARGIRAYNVQPGYVLTERMAVDIHQFGFDPSTMAPPDVVGAVVAWLVTAPDAAEPNGRTLEAQDVCRELGLLPGWPP